MNCMKKSSKVSNLRIERIGKLNYSVARRDVKYPRIEFKTGKMVVIVPRNFQNEKEILTKNMGWISRKHKEILDAYKKVYKTYNKKSILAFEGFDSLDSIQKLKKKLHNKISIILDEYSKNLNLKYGKVSIKNQKTKWGSCSKKGNLSFNFKLMFLPHRLVKYVVFHELLHLKERNHRFSFWRLIEREFKDYRKLEKSLLEYWFFLQKSNKQLNEIFKKR